MKNKLLILFSFFLVLSCAHNKNDAEKREIVNINLPDTVQLMDTITVSLQYKIELDSSISKNIDERYVFFHAMLDQNKEILNLKDLKKRKVYIAEDTVGDGKFQFKLTFDKKGVNFFHGAIEDYRILKSDKPNPDSLKTRTISPSLTKRIIVIDKKQD